MLTVLSLKGYIGAQKRLSHSIFKCHKFGLMVLHFSSLIGYIHNPKHGVYSVPPLVRSRFLHLLAASCSFCSNATQTCLQWFKI